MLVWLIERLTEKEPRNRIQSTLKVVEVLIAIQQGLEGEATMGITTAEKRYVIPQDSAADPNHDTEKKPIREEETEPAPSQDNGGQESAFFCGKRMLLRLIGGVLVLLLFTSGWLLISQRSLVKAVTNLGHVETQTTVTLDTLPANAEVYEEGVLLGTTPFVISLRTMKSKPSPLNTTDTRR